MPEWPRYRADALKDERRWVDSLDDRELAQHAAELGRIDKAVATFHAKTEPQEEDAA